MFDTHPTRTMPHHSANALASADFAKTQTHSAKTALFHRFSPNWSALWRPNSVKSRLCRHQSGGIALHEGATRRRHAVRRLRVVQNPHRHRRGERRGHGEPGRSAHEQRQGAAIARLLARGLRQSTALFAQQQPHLAASVQNSPCTPALAACAVQNSPRTPLLTACPVQNSPCSPEMAQFRACSACRESFIPFSPPRSQAGRILYRTQGRDRASQHNNTPGTTGMKQKAPEEPQDPAAAQAAAGWQGQHGLAGLAPDKFRMQFDWTKFQQTQKTLQFQRCKFNI